MNELIYSVIYILIDFLGTYLNYCYLKMLNGHAVYNRKWELCSYVVWHVLNYLLVLCRIPPFLLVSINCIVIFLITMNYASTFKRKLISLVLTVLISLISEIVISFIFGNSLDKTSVNVQMGLCSKAIVYGTWLLFSKFLTPTFKYRKSYIRLHLPLAFLVVMLYSNTLLQLGDFTFQQMMSSIIIMIIMLVILVYVSKMDYDRITAEYLFARQRAEIQKYQYEQILKSDADAISLSKRLDMYLRKIKDVIGRSYEQTDEVDEFIRQALAENISVDSVPLQTDNLIIDSIINSQVFKARAQGFEIDCKALIPEQINTASIKDEMAYGINKLLDAAFDNGESISDRKIRILLRFQANCIFLFVLYQVDETNRKAAGELTKANRKVIDAINETFPRHRGLAHYEVAKREAVWSLMIFSD